MILFKATGRQIKELLQRHTPAVSGLKYRVQDRELLSATIDGQPIDDDKVYSGVANSYFAGYALKGITVTDTGKARLETLITYIKEKKVVRPSYDGRRVVIRNSWRP
jgi:outer membrane protein assembly factor BamB